MNSYLIFMYVDLIYKQIKGIEDQVMDCYSTTVKAEIFVFI